ncbi:MAG: PE domain-containing protein [Gammaproteobacteria bacterium]
MSRDTHSIRRLAALVLLALALAACKTTQERPPPPQPQVERPPPEPTPREPAAATQPAAPATTGQTTPDGADNGGEPASQAFAEPSPNAADVQIDEIPVDADGNPLPRPAGGGGGAAAAGELARMNDELEARERAANAQPTGAAPAAADLVGPEMAIGARTAGERVEALDQQLDQQLRAFDERMARARAAAAAARSAGGMASGVEDGRGGRLEPGGERGAGGAATTASGIGNTPDLSGDNSAGAYRQAAVPPAPQGIPDGRDDDIVARQLREAASRESDPVLREKLWEEYRRYKAGI